MTELFITGATGFVGRHLLARVRENGHAVRALVRRPSAITGAIGSGATIEAIEGDLLRPESYRSALQASATVVHLGALTGKAKREDHYRVNLAATEDLLKAAADAGVARFLFVSSIAGKFEVKGSYPYADAKARAEEAVRASGLAWTIVRPTMVIGKGSPILDALTRLAKLPVTPVFGDGLNRVQPVDVGDLAEFLANYVEAGEFDGQVLEVGGPEVLTMTAFLQAIRASHSRGTGPMLHLPLWPIRTAVSALETIVGPRALPVSTGQLTSFVCESTAEPNALSKFGPSSPKGVSDMLELGTTR